MTVENSYKNLDAPQQNAENAATKPVVDMSDPSQVRSTFKASGSQSGVEGSTVLRDDQLTFSNPFTDHEHLDPQSRWHMEGNTDGQSKMPLSDSINTDAAALPTDSTAASQMAILSLEQAVVTELQAVETVLQQVIAEVANQYGGLPVSQSGSDSQPSTITTPANSGDNTSTTTSPASTGDSTTTPVTTSPGDNTSTTTSPASTGDSTTTPVTTSSGDNTSTTTSPASTGDSTTTPVTTSSGDSTPTTTASTSANSGDKTTLAGSLPTSSDSFIAGLQMSDPVLAKTLTDASKQLSAAGYSKLEANVKSTETADKTWVSGNPAFDASVMSGQLNKAGLSSADQTALSNVLKSDMPAALAPDTFIAAIQKPDPTMAKVLTDAKSSLTQTGYETLEGYIESHYDGNPNESTGVTDQTFVDNVLNSEALKGGLSSADSAAFTKVLKADDPAALASDQLQATLQSSDPTLAKTLSDASGKLSSAGYADLENYVEENSTWNTANDKSLMYEALKNGGMTSADTTALTSVLQSDMPGATSAAPSSAVLEEMKQAKYDYSNSFAINDLNHPGWVDGNPGKINGILDNDLVPTDTTKIGPWAVVAPVNENSYNKDAQAEISNVDVYYHLKTGGWVEASSPATNTGTFWEGHYNSNFTVINPGDGKVSSNGTFDFTAPPSNNVDHFGVGTNAYDPSKYDGVYETMTAQTNVANSGLAMNMGADYFETNGPKVRAGAESNWVPLTTTPQTMSLSTLDNAELEADPPPGF